MYFFVRKGEIESKAKVRKLEGMYKENRPTKSMKYQLTNNTKEEN